MRQLKSAATPLSLRSCHNTIHSGIRRTAILLYRIVPPDTRFLYKNHVFTAVQALFSYNLVWITVYGRLTLIPAAPARYFLFSEAGGAGGLHPPPAALVTETHAQHKTDKRRPQHAGAFCLPF